MSKWEKITIEDCISLSSGKFLPDKKRISGQYDVFGGNGIVGTHNEYNVDFPTIVIGRVGVNCGCVHKSLNKAWITDNALYATQFHKEVDLRYLAYALARKNFNSKANKSGQPSISQAAILNESIYLPPIEVQKQIAGTLDKASRLIELRKTQLEKMDLLIKSKFVEMFGDKCHFATMPLIDIIIDGAGLSYGIVQPGDDGTGDMGVLRPVDIVNGEIELSTIKYIDRSIGSGFKRTQLTGSELIITVRGTTGIAALTDERFNGMNVTRGIAVVRYNEIMVNKYYLCGFLQSDVSQRYIQEHTQGATLQQINLADLRSMPILLPPLPLQIEFAEFMQSVKKQKELMRKGFEKLMIQYNAFTQEFLG